MDSIIQFIKQFCKEAGLGSWLVLWAGIFFALWAILSFWAGFFLIAINFAGISAGCFWWLFNKYSEKDEQDE